MSDGYIGVDVGGTFTDVFLIDAAGSRAVSAKYPTSRPDPTIGILGALQLLKDSLADPGSIREVTVGSTLALNAVIESKGARTALLTTDGFTDIIEIGRENRDRLYDLDQPSPTTLIPAELRYPITERIDARGQVVQPLAVDESALFSWLEDHHVESVAICMLHSYCNPSHEERLRDLLIQARPDLYISASIDVHPHYREYERTLTTVINAYVGPTMTDYLNRLQDGVRGFAPNAKVRITDSLGGAVNFETARAKPVLTVMSGPASGVAGARTVGEQTLPSDSLDLVGMDMGGTTCDVSVVQDGLVDVASTVAVGSQRFALRTVDIHSIGAGGGTIAHVDDGGLLRVGPQSTGSVPGPACYGKGGTAATITDAHAVLGHFHPDDRLGGTIAVDSAAAEAAIRSNVADPLGLSVTEAAAGILAVADASMRRAIEAITVRRGLDPREFALVGFGGAAALHAAAIGDSIGMRAVLVPRFGGVLAAMGAASASEQYEASVNCLVHTSTVSGLDLQSWQKELVQRVRESAHPGGDMLDAVEYAQIEYLADVRFIGQTAVLEVSVPRDDPDPSSTIHRRFVERYQKIYGYALDGVDSEIESVRVRLTLPPSHSASAPSTEGLKVATPSRWSAAFGSGDLIDCHRWVVGPESSLPPVIHGPAVISSVGATALVHPGQRAKFDRFGNLAIVLAHEE